MLNTVDMHCDTIMKVYQSKQEGTYEKLRKNTFQIDQKKLIEGGYLLQNFALFMDIKDTEDPYQTCKEMVQCFYDEMEDNKDWILPVTTYQEIMVNQQNGKLSAMLTMEEGAPIRGELNKLEEFYQAGVRMMTLTWNYPNEIGYPNAAFFDEQSQLLSIKQKGLTEQGIAIVQRMEQLGMIIDVSHGSDQLVEDILTYTQKPFVASHSNARAICPHFRNLPDHLIKKIADRGGVIGMNYCDLFVTNNDSETLIDGLVKHIKHFQTVGGIDCIGLGSDFDGIPITQELPDASAVNKLYQALVREGFSSDELEKIFSSNVLRVYKDVLR